MPTIILDDFDRKILRRLMRDATLPVAELAAEVGLSTSPCWRRIKRLQEAGVITGQVARVDRRAVGLHALGYVHVSLLDHTEATIHRFETFVQNCDQIAECASITGADDYLLKIHAEDAEGLERFLMRDLLALGCVRSSTTHFVLRQTKATSALPV